MPYRTIIALFAALALAACSSEDDVTGSTNSCVAKLYSSFNRKDMAQCVGACKACERGTTITCSTSCTLRGAK
jgi:hypothetical protein